MLDQQRIKKRILIAAIIAVAVIFLSGGIYLFFKSSATCFDKKKNQGETGVDCGGPCQITCDQTFETKPIEVIEKYILYSGPEKYDVLLRVRNPNALVGSSQINYSITLTDSQNNTLTKREGKSFILPAETKYIIETNIESATSPQDIAVTMGESNWQEFSELEEPRLTISNKRYNLVSSQAFFSEALGVIRNESQMSFKEVKINVVLKDEQGQPIAVNSTIINSFPPNEERDFRMVWPAKFPGSVQNLEMEAEANVFDLQSIKSEIPEAPFGGYR